MAHSVSTTTEGYTGLGIYVAGEDATDVVKSIVNIETACTANAAQTYAGITKITDSGLAIADATVTSETTTVADDTVQVTKKFDVTATKAIKGAAMCNDADDRIYVIVCWEVDVNVENGDDYTPTISMQFKAD